MSCVFMRKLQLILPSMRRAHTVLFLVSFLVPSNVSCGGHREDTVPSKQELSPPREEGIQSADFRAASVRGGTFHMREHAGHAVLFAFLQTQPDSGLANPSRALVPMLLSLDRQYRKAGVDVVIVDATSLAEPVPDGSKQRAGARISGLAPPIDALLNTSYDWSLTIPLLADPDGALAKMYGVDRVPTLLLVDPAGRTVQRWIRWAHPASLAAAIQRIVGGPMSDRPPQENR
jgi:hypothetical protein